MPCRISGGRCIIAPLRGPWPDHLSGCTSPAHLPSKPHSLVLPGSGNAHHQTHVRTHHTAPARNSRKNLSASDTPVFSNIPFPHRAYLLYLESGTMDLALLLSITVVRCFRLPKTANLIRWPQPRICTSAFYSRFQLLPWRKHAGMFRPLDQFMHGTMCGPDELHKSRLAVVAPPSYPGQARCSQSHK